MLKEARLPFFVVAPTEKPMPRHQATGWSSRRMFDRVAGLELVARSCYDEDAVLGRIVQGLLLQCGCLDPADQREVDDLGAVVDHVDDGVGLVDVAEGAVRAAGLDEKQLRVAAEAGDSLSVRPRPPAIEATNVP